MVKMKIGKDICKKGVFSFFFFFLYCYYFLNDNLRVVRMKESIFGFFFGAKK
jgi:hypothetical protein